MRILLLCLIALPASGQISPGAEFFETKVRPILASQCVGCHGAARHEGGLRLDSRAAAVVGGRHGAAVNPDRPDASLLLKAIRYNDPTLKMPPAGKLKDEQIAALERWVAMKAPWPSYQKPSAEEPLWSLNPVRKPALPAVKTPAWVRNPIDAFVLKKLEAAKMTPAPGAGRRELIRRATFDLTGLPPTPEEIRSFESDKSPNAYEKVIDRLLASPRYGERWARYWLDLVRYADTNGYERDGEKPYSWKYRDWVIKSLNEDMRYDRFVTLQLAGDEVPDRSESTVTATGFLRLGTWDDEPNDPAEYKYERLDDLVHATSAAFMGFTVRCARCHDHKFDPIPQRDYYAIAAAFYAGYLDPGDGKLMGGPPPEKLGFPVLGFTDSGREIKPIHLLGSGDARKEGPEVAPGFLTCVGNYRRTVEPPAPDSPTTRRRLQLAEWITDPRNPLTARVIVNRVWMHHFGRGIVSTPNNFGRKGSPPSNAELLDWLASSFIGELPSTSTRTSTSTIQTRLSGGDAGGMNSPDLTLRRRLRGLAHESAELRRDARGMNSPSRQSEVRLRGLNTQNYSCGWSLKRLHRVIMLSNAYRMISLHPRQAEYEKVDFVNEKLWRFNRRRLDADALRDSMLAVSGELNLKMGGQGFQPWVNHEALEGLSRKGAEWNPSTPEEQNRRSVYMYLKRALIMPLMTAFDFADTTSPLEQRDVTIVPTQALTLMNNSFVAARAEAFARKLEDEFGSDRAASIKRAWQIAYGRMPSEMEARQAAAFLGERKSSQFTAGSPPAPPVLFLAAGKGISLDSHNRVSSWKDLSGIEFGQPNEAARPEVVTNVLNGQPALRFDGKGRFLSNPEKLLKTQQYTIVAVASDRAGGGSHREIFSNWNGKAGNIADALFLGTTGYSTIRFTDHFVPAGNLVAPTQPFVLTAVADAGSTVVYQNRAEIARKQIALPPRNLMAPWVIGQQGNINGEFWNGDIFEIMVFDRALTDFELGQVWDSISIRFGIAVRPKQADPALSALCHVLFNSNEFVFVD